MMEMPVIPFFSIIIPSYNKEKYIEETLLSLIEQTMSDFEVIIVDDFSKDKTREIINEFACKDSRIKIFVNERNMGANYSRNFGIKQAKAPYIIFLDADDLLQPFCLKRRQKKILEAPDKNIWVFTMAVFRYKKGDTDYVWLPSSINPLKDFLCHKLPWQTMQPVWSKTFVESLGGFDLKIERLDDVELHTRALLSKEIRYALCNGEADCYYRIDERRKSYNVVTFLKKWMNSSTYYCNKFEEQVPKNYKRFLYGTVFQSFLQLLHHYKKKEMSRGDFIQLKEIIMKASCMKNISGYRMSLFWLAEFYNKYFPRIPGINWFIKKLIIW